MYKYPLFFQDSYITTSQSTSCLLKLIREGECIQDGKETYKNRS